MKKIQNYEILEKIEETTGSLIYRGRKIGNKNTIIMKILKTSLLSPSEIARFKQEYEIIKSIDYEGIIKTYEILNHEDGFALVLEDFNGESIYKILDEIEVFDIKTFLQTGIKIAKAIGEIHKKNIIHRDIKPDNILLNRKDGRIKITDFGISILITHENEQIYNPEVIQGTLFYMSPEQIGRINRIVDYRTDLYSLGVTFYKMLTGTTPFESNNPLTIIHSHIAREPVPVVKRRAAVPVIISDIIMKLMAKDPEDRYQNAFGLEADLTECSKKIDKTQGIEPFELAKYDISNRFIISQKLFGREKEIDILTLAFERVSGRAALAIPEAGSCEMILISGSPGIGKSALINEFNKLIIEKNGYFLSGKYEQFRKDKPYCAIIQAFHTLFKQILSESDEVIKIIRENILKALGRNAKIMIDIIPDLEMVIGKQPEVPKLAPDEEKNRINIVFKNFIKVFTKKEHPIVLCLDDLQWADPASLKLIKNVMTGSNIRYLLIIGCFRDNEVNAEHPLTEVLGEIGKAGIRVNRILLEELSEDTIKDLIVHLLKCPENRGFSLAQLVHKKTGGNPFFINGFLLTLYKKKLIQSDHQMGWDWDIKEINKMHITDNVVEFLSNKITEFPENIQTMLKICSCIGNRFDPETISFLLDKSIKETLADLTEVMDEGFINIIGNVYLFQHDRIQEAAYSLVPEEEKPFIHYRIGKLLLDKTDTAEIKDKIFYIVDQLNLGLSLIKEGKEKEDLVRMNYESGKKARASAAYVPALRYFKTGLSLLKKDCWEKQYELTLTIFTEIVETAYLCGDYDAMNQYASIVINTAKNVYDTIPVYETKIHANDALLNFKESIKIALTVLEKLHYPMHEKPGKLQILIALLKIKPFLSVRKIDSLIDLPEMNNHHILIVLQILSLLGKSSFYVSPGLFAYTVIKETELSIKYGHCQVQSFNYTGMAILLIGIFGDIEAGYKLGNLALALGKKLNARRYEARIICIYNIFISHWKKHIKTIIPEFIKSYNISIETGELEWASYSLFFYDYYTLLIGYELTELEQQMSKTYKKIEQFNQISILGLHSMRYQFVLNLLGRSTSPVELTGTAFDEAQMIPLWETSGAKTLLGSFYNSRLILRYIFGDYQGAIIDSNNSFKYLGSLTCLIAIRDYAFYSSLTRLALMTKVSGRKKREYKQFVRLALKKFKKWSKHAPMNNEHQMYIIMAEMARVLGNYTQAEAFYDRAIRLSKKDGYLIREAIACELAFKYYKLHGKEKVARIYLIEAYTCYARWGATAKLNQLKQKYPELITIVNRYSTVRPDSSGKLSSSGTTSQYIDLTTVVKASQAISGEVALGKLLAKIMKLVMENAGAQKGFLILEEKGKYLVEAEGTIENEAISVLNAIPVDGHGGLSQSIVNYVVRTKKILILNNAKGEGDFTHDPYVRKNNPKSTLCAPIINQGKLTGILYLENNLSTGAFTQERLNILNILSSQMAISIENAKLYENLEDKVRERTTQLNKANQKLKELSLDDPLTNLRNRRYVYEIVIKSTNLFIKNQVKLLNQNRKRVLNIENKVFGVFMIDIDHFKKINDMYGHRAGDKVLITMSAVLKKITRENDTIVRWGGEEFLIILQNTRADYLKKFSKKILETVRNISFELFDNITIKKTCSVGCAKIPLNANHPDLLNWEQTINLSDFALYAAKENGRNKAAHIKLKNRVVIDEEIKQYLSTLSKKTAINKNYILIEFVE